jgi:alpha-glucosidase
MADWKDCLHSDGSPEFLHPQNPSRGSKITLKIRTLKDHPLTQLYLQFNQRGQLNLKPLQKMNTGQFFEIYGTTLKLKDKSTPYSFVLYSASEVYYYDQAGLSKTPGETQHQFRILVGFQELDWVTGRTFYQIFPDRFFCKNEYLTPKDKEYSFQGHYSKKMDWDAKPLEFKEGHCLDFFGGDLPGVLSKLDYLQNLGVSALYLNPIFHAASHHKYDCQDYKQVDPHLGGNQSLVELVEGCQKRDIAVILDISVNHTGSSHRWFNQEGDYGDTTGAFNNQESIEHRFYLKRGRGFHHWAGVDSLLTLNYGSEALRAEIYGNTDSVLKHWLKEPYSINGWRFDVGHCMAREGQGPDYLQVWRELRCELKQTKPSAWLMAEFWDDPFEFLQGDCWDSSMNYYGFLRPVRRFLGETDWTLRNTLAFQEPATATELQTMLDQVRTKLPFQMQNQQFNLLGSHDIHRLYNRPGFTFDQHRLAAILLMTYPGLPCIYYGDEQELMGHLKSNEGYRYPLRWYEGQEKEAAFLLYQGLARLRQKTKALGNGGYKVLFCKGKTLAYARFINQDCILSVVSMEDKTESLSLPLILAGDFTSKSVFKELFHNHSPLKFSRKSQAIKIPGKSGLIFTNL